MADSVFIKGVAKALRSELNRMRDQAKVMGSRELSLAITKLEECLMWLQEAI